MVPIAPIVLAVGRIDIYTYHMGQTTHGANAKGNEMTTATTKYFQLLDGADQKIGTFAAADVRAEVEKLAGGKDWGWREGADGHYDAVCDYVVIAQAYQIPV
jgi:hypothetical protein